MENSEFECPHQDDVKQVYGAIFVNGHPKGSLMVRMASVESKADSIDQQFIELKTSIDRLPRTILTWLLIMTALIGIFGFLAPSLRKMIGMAATTHQVKTADDAAVPLNP